MSTEGATNLNRILRLTANLLFQNGEPVVNVQKLLQGFVSPAMVRKWHERYCLTNGIPTEHGNVKKRRRMPMPPIDFDAIDIKSLDKMLDKKNDSKQNEPEPE